MIIWILAVLLLGLFAAAGYFRGAIRSLVCLAGLVGATMLALPLAPLVQPLFPLIGVNNQLWVWFWPPVLVFVLILIVMGIVAFIVHRQIELHYKYKTDDLQYLRWQRMNQRMGVGIGLVEGVASLLIVGWIVYVIGYATVQVAAGEEAPLPMRLLNSARAGLAETGLDKLVAALDRTPEQYYEATDVVALVYHNPLLHSRLATYPAFFSMAERPELQDIATDTEYSEMLQRHENAQQIIEHPKTQAILKNDEILQELKQLDLKDLLKHLETGQSPKYESEKIIGRWQMHPGASLSEIKKASPNLGGAEMNNLRKALTVFLSGMTLTATPDNRVFFKVKSAEEIQKEFEAQLAQIQAQGVDSSGAVPQPRPPGPGLSARSLTSRIVPNSPDYQMQQRYGGIYPSAPPPETVVAPAAPPSNPVPNLALAGEGAWKKEDDRYTLTAQQDGREQAAAVTVRGDYLVVSFGGLALVFERL